MKLSRREALGLGAAAIAAGGCGRILGQIVPEPLPAEIGVAPSMHPTHRFLARTGFGPRPGDVARAHKLGLAHIRQRFFETYEELNERPDLLAKLGRLDVVRVDPAFLDELPEREVLDQLQTATLLRAVYARNSFRERMVDFWANHFNIYARKQNAAILMGREDSAIIRKHALGTFPNLLVASATSPAMMVYLDNAKNRKGIANENYARELMELHTLGVGNYTQKDVQEVARCFTGWTVEDRFLHDRSQFRFNPEVHDDGEKVVLGKRIPAGGGERDGAIVLELVAKHSATASHLAQKLVRFFLGEGEFSHIESQVVSRYLETGGSIPAMVTPILDSEELLTGPPTFRRPFDFMAAALRALNANVDISRGLLVHLEKMGQPLRQWPMPDGYPIEPEMWMANLLPRWNFALALMRKEVQGAIVNIENLVQKGHASPAEMLVGLTIGPNQNGRVPLVEKVLQQSGLEEAAALCLCLPEFQLR